MCDTACKHPESICYNELDFLRMRPIQLEAVNCEFRTGELVMSIEIVQGATQKPASSRELVKILSQDAGLTGQMFTGYPVFKTPEGPYLVDALLISEEIGLVVFDLIEGTDTSGYCNRQDDSANMVDSKLRTHRDLLRRRELRIPVHTISFAPGINRFAYQVGDDYPIVFGGDDILSALRNFEWLDSDTDVYRAALSAVESLSTIRKNRVRRITKVDSRGAKLKNLEDSIATLDNAQSKAVIETVDDVQRIRGLAGSGKTIVLALKAAYLHAQHPDWRIAVTFNTRSLKGQFRRLIYNFSLEQTGEEPDWENLRILNAWGAPGDSERDGIYYEFCRLHGVDYFDFRSARNTFTRGKEFSGVCERALNQATDAKPAYNAILIDEAQDFSPAFLRLCYELLGESKRLVYAYDELQNLHGESMPSPEDIFGKRTDGTPNVNLDSERGDIILKTCYRNSRPVLVTAHSLGFGIYRESQTKSGTGLVQMFDQPQLWTEVGYQVKAGELNDGQPVTLQRPDDTSPKFLENHSPIDDLIQFMCFDNSQEQADWLSNAIRGNLQDDELRHDDIVVINPNPVATRNNVGPIRRRLLDMGINSHLAGVDANPDVFFKSSEESVTFSGIFRAKGNEAGMVYIIHAEDCHSERWNLANRRNQLFTAITRSKAWVRVLGIGNGMNELIKEYERLKEQNFELDFVYPTEDQREHLSIVHRDMTEEERSKQLNRQQSLRDLVDALRSGEEHIEDMDKDTLDALEELRKILG